MNSFLNALASAGDDDDACGGNADFKMDMVDVFGDVCHHVDIDTSDFSVSYQHGFVIGDLLMFDYDDNDV